MRSIDTTTSDLARWSGTWVLDPEKTTVTFRTKAMWVLPVKGTAKALSGDAQISPDGAVKGTLIIDAAGGRRRTPPSPRSTPRAAPCCWPGRRCASRCSGCSPSVQHPERRGRDGHGRGRADHGGVADPAAGHARVPRPEGAAASRARGPRATGGAGRGLLAAVGRRARRQGAARRSSRWR